MPLPDELKFLEKLTNSLKMDISGESLARCLLWMLLFLGLAHYHAPRVVKYLPYGANMNAQNLTPLSTAAADPRWSRNDIKIFPDNSIAWIAGSSIAIQISSDLNYRFLPAQTKTNMTQYVSLKMARRMLDTYTMVKDSIKRTPSAMVIVLNPFWDLQDSAAFFKENLMNAGAHLWLNKQDLWLIPLLSSPRNILWAVIGQRHHFIGNSYDYLKTLQLKYTPQKKQEPQTAKKQKLSYNQPVLFWMMNRYNEGKDFSNFDVSKWQVAAMAQNNIERSEWGQKLLKNMLETVKESNIPTLIYIAPVNPALEQTEARVSYRTVTGQISEIMKEYQGTNIRFVTPPKNIINSMIYTDYLHVKDSSKLPVFLTKEISDMMREKK